MGEREEKNDFPGMEGMLVQEMEPEPPVQESSVPSEGKKLSYNQDGEAFLPTLLLLSLPLWLVCFSCTSSFLFLFFSTSTFLCSSSASSCALGGEERSCGVAAPCSDPCSVTHGLGWKGNSQCVE